MFNHSAFNLAPFNVSTSVDVMFSFGLAGEGYVSFQPSADISLSLTLEGDGYATSDFVRELGGSVAMIAEGFLQSGNVRELSYQLRAHAEGFLSAKAKKTTITSLTVSDVLPAGGKFVIDTANFRILKSDGTYADYIGDFFDLAPGDNAITYTDAATGRTVQIRVTWRDRYL